jgi:hypothetical protein
MGQVVQGMPSGGRDWPRLAEKRVRSSVKSRVGSSLSEEME